MEIKKKSANSKPFVSIVIPGYNEEALVSQNLKRICSYMHKLDDKFNWELVFVNDGSTDRTGILADEISLSESRLKVIHHVVNLNLGNALKTGFANVSGEYIITLDVDLSYATNHIEDILNTLTSTKADVVIASPYMKGGKVTAVPFLRKILSIWVNRIMRIASQEKFHTYTSMVRGYRTDFVKGLNLKAEGFEICPEILYKSMILRARIIEIPAHLDWTEQSLLGEKRKSGIRLIKGFFFGLMSSFIFRPYFFFLIAGIILLAISFYLIAWIFYFVFKTLPAIPYDPQAFDDRFSLAIKQVYQLRPHLFFIGGVILLASIQVLSLGFLSLQSKRYFEELFHLNTSIFRRSSKINTPE